MTKPASKILSACCLIGILTGIGHGAESLFVPDNPGQGDESLSVLEYLGQRASRMANALPGVPDSVADWEAQSAKIRADLAALLGLPEREPMKAILLDSKEQDGLIIDQVGYLWAERAYVSGNVIRQKDAEGRLPGLVVPPGWLGHYTQPCYKNFVFQMANRGYVVLFIDDPHIGKRQAPYAGLYAAASAGGTQVMGIQVFDTLRGLDYMLTRADVDPGRIGVVGLCQGAEQAWLAGALESRFQFVVPVCGTTTYEGWARMPAFEGVALSDPSPYVAGVLDRTDWDRTGACIAPRPVFVASNSGDNWWPEAGYEQVIRTMEQVYGLYDAGDRFRHIRDLRSHDMTPYIPEIAPWIDARVKSLKPSDARPQPCGEAEDPDFKMLRHFERIATADPRRFPESFASRADWETYRQAIVEWLRETCNLDTMKPGADKKGPAYRPAVESGDPVPEPDTVAIETVRLKLDGDFNCLARLVRLFGPFQQKRASIILSHDSPQCMSDPQIVSAAVSLAKRGYWVIVPEHASTNPASLQPADSRGLISLYGVGDTVGLPPLALRVADNLAAFAYLSSRKEIDADRIVTAGLGIGAIDACLAAVLEERIAGAACIDVTTTRDWLTEIAAERLSFSQLMPYLPGILTETDLDYLFGALAPRPLLIGRLVDGLPESGFNRIKGTAAGVYGLYESPDGLTAVGPRGVSEEMENAAPEGVERQLLAAARVIMPEPPTPGLVGAESDLISRQTTDSAAGIVWIVSQRGGFDQQFVDGGYELDSWEFFNDNGDAQKDRQITPLIIKKDGDSYTLTGIGKTRTNTGAGPQAFPFELAAGSPEVGNGYYFGWHTGDSAGKQNAGVVEYDAAPRDQMTILTLDGNLSGQKITLDARYREQSNYPRKYSIRAISSRK